MSLLDKLANKKRGGIKMNKVFGLGIIGAGGIFHEHARTLETLKDRARLIGVADVDQIKLAKASSKYFVPYTFTDYRSLFDRNDIDIIVVATPPSTHEKFVIESFQAGKHVICEKPLAHTLESADRIIDALSSYKCKLTVCYHDRFTPVMKRIIWLQENGWLGNLQCGSIQRLDTFRRAAASDWWGKWEIAGGGVMMTQCIHELDLLIKVFGKPMSVFAIMDTLKQNIESEDTCVATVKFESGAHVSCNATLNAHRTTTLFDIIGDKASAHFPWAVYSNDRKHSRELTGAMTSAQLISKAQNGMRSSVIQKLKDKFGGDSLPAKVMRRILPKLGIHFQAGSHPLHRPIITGFLDSLQGNVEVPVSANEARKSLELCYAIYTSALTGEVVSLPLEKSNPYYKGITSDVYRNRKTS
ncbi:gfo/Idh/MocA family oxidoreductase [candidate division WS5 bacterium]|uniref:Gfo/Idh/MocA family oxidoreductase n=1 Tax=candidate division WS5 bacterium TaxID=2093353 RepID=A0A419DDE8_9BACT|nr:MAG: gfo/Idh/MocA family oxidoreductase [candidate division WS5 bacterium]